jgi:hypothetical protein
MTPVADVAFVPTKSERCAIFNGFAGEEVQTG